MSAQHRKGLDSITQTQIETQEIKNSTEIIHRKMNQNEENISDIEDRIAVL